MSKNMWTEMNMVCCETRKSPTSLSRKRRTQGNTRKGSPAQRPHAMLGSQDVILQGDEGELLAGVELGETT